VFDTVAALGASGLRRLLMNMGLLLAVLLTAAAAALLAEWAIGLPFRTAFVATAGAMLLVLGDKIIRSRLKIIRNFPAEGMFDWHWAGWRFKFYDTNLHKDVSFARHALAVDETRIDFKRVPWGQPSEDEPEPQPGIPERFQQIWFAGNHSDIGGSYPEEESRLSDIALEWLVGEATSLPHPILVDRTKLKTYPAADGRQHCEVESLLSRYPRWIPKPLRRGWKAKPRYEASGATLHPTVRDRLNLEGVVKCGRFFPYRPEALSKDPSLTQYYAKSAAPAAGSNE
jgi:hypothetical protein